MPKPNPERRKNALPPVFFEGLRWRLDLADEANFNIHVEPAVSRKVRGRNFNPHISLHWNSEFVELHFRSAPSKAASEVKIKVPTSDLADLLAFTMERLAPHMAAFLDLSHARQHCLTDLDQTGWLFLPIGAQQADSTCIEALVQRVLPEQPDLDAPTTAHRLDMEELERLGKANHSPVHQEVISSSVPALRGAGFGMLWRRRTWKGEYCIIVDADTAVVLPDLGDRLEAFLLEVSGIVQRHPVGAQLWPKVQDIPAWAADRLALGRGEFTAG